MSEMRDYMLDFMRSHELSMAKLAELLGYKSKTSLARLMEDSSRPKSVIQFEAAMRRAFTLTEAEDAALHRAVAMTILGRATYLAQEEMWRFVRGESVCDGRCHRRADRSEKALFGDDQRSDCAAELPQRSGILHSALAAAARGRDGGTFHLLG